uniref:Uncharacterized protein n=1 Tax=Nelumbo nucifera TaxID=4432 RepID=A0A822ZW39_NELNU|nr:TPA_asm: hypothetical protein HUJ06_017482 [Nelumbo nucifera]
MRGPQGTEPAEQRLQKSHQINKLACKTYRKDLERLKWAFFF